MDETPRTISPVGAGWGPKKWMALVVGGLVLGEAVWIAIVALTRDVILPLMAMALGDTSSPLSLGKQDFNFPDLFTAVLELCLAGLFAILVYAWIQRRPRTAPKSLSLTPANSPQISRPTTAAFKPAAETETPKVLPASESAAPISASVSSPPRSVAPEVTASQAPAAAKSQTAAASAPDPTTSKPQPPAAPASPKSKPAKPKEPKPVYYNIVGERITPDDGEDI